MEPSFSGRNTAVSFGLHLTFHYRTFHLSHTLVSEGKEERSVHRGSQKERTSGDQLVHPAVESRVLSRALSRHV